jgi:predicted naringenin-chalcone synthase
MSVEVARRAMGQCRGITSADVTHVITTTCTGFSSPGPDYHIVREVGMRPSTQRYALGFMGCYAALPALRMAWQFCQADPSAVVLVVSVELCSLHLHFEDGMDSLLANALFADGAAAAIVSAREPCAGRSAYRLDSFASALIPGAEKDMAWRIGDKGFEITLSTYVPDVIGANIRSLIEPTLAASGLLVKDIGRWAVHPGGKAILDKVQNELQLTPGQTQASRDVLHRYGNMSSATSLFVLKELLDAGPLEAADGRVCAIAFGPGLTVESAILGLVNG